MGKIYKVGDTITITKEMVNAFKESSAPLKIQHARGRSLLCGDFDAWLGKKGVCYAQRLDRSHGQMAIDWGKNEKTNVYWLEDIGLEFEFGTADCPELPIMECPEKFLTASELVIKTLIGEGNTEAEATTKVYEVQRAMAVHGIVFYMP